MFFWKVRWMQAGACCLEVEPVQQACLGRAVREGRCPYTYPPDFTASGSNAPAGPEYRRLILKGSKQGMQV